jgi:excinuclease ABC subunit A
MKGQAISIRGARVHNLKNINVDIPRNKIVVITGLSGSGKSSLAFDLIYAEAERRFVESLSSYARQFLGIKEKPEVDSIRGLSPAIAIDQGPRHGGANPRSTVGTITEIYDYLRILYARFGAPHCPQCGKPVSRQSVEDMMKYVLVKKKGEYVILAPVIEGKKGEHKAVLEDLYANGFVRVRRDGEIVRTQEAIESVVDRKKTHTIEAVVDRFTISKTLERARLRESFETALKIGKGKLIINDGKNDFLFSEHLACMQCTISLPAIEPRLFSFNSPYGACPSCMGLGNVLEVDPELVMPNRDLSLAEGAIQPWMRASHRLGRQSWYWWSLEQLSHRHHFSLETPIKTLSEKIVHIILYGEEPGFEGVIPNLTRRWKETESEWTRAEIERFMTSHLCPACQGARLKPEARGVRVFGENLPALCTRAASDLLIFFKKHAGGPAQRGGDLPSPLAPLGNEIIKRLQFLVDVGLDYLSLDRSSLTLAGGESQRVRLATQIGSQLTGVIYVLDEPSIGLHARDQHRLLRTLAHLRNLGNTILVVEHDAQTMQAADWIIDLGPGAGRYGGKVIFQGTPKQALAAPTLTGAYLSGKKTITLAKKRDRSTPRSGTAAAPHVISLRGAKEHNLKNISVDIPLGRLVCVAGVSGSGKSTLVNDILACALRRYFFHSRETPGEYQSIEGLESLNKVIVVDQSPIGRTPRSNPATYTGAFTPIRDLFAKTQEARTRGYSAGRFSFNVKGGRCEACEGAGVKKIEMYFLPDVYQECEECKGKRYNREALEILFQGKTIAEVLDMEIGEAEAFFAIYPAIREKLASLRSVGLDYIKLGQAATTLSGGEAQRIKLATELARRATGKTLYILDEPTVGLHFEDVQKLLNVLNALVEKGNTVLIIEHHLDVLRNADWIIELGPEGGEAGGHIIATGTPQDLKKNKSSLTGQWLRRA